MGRLRDAPGVDGQLHPLDETSDAGPADAGALDVLVGLGRSPTGAACRRKTVWPSWPSTRAWITEQWLHACRPAGTALIDLGADWFCFRGIASPSFWGTSAACLADPGYAQPLAR
jgi:hypothetical protein